MSSLSPSWNPTYSHVLLPQWSLSSTAGKSFSLLRTHNGSGHSYYTYYTYLCANNEWKFLAPFYSFPSKYSKYENQLRHVWGKYLLFALVRLPYQRFSEKKKQEDPLKTDCVRQDIHLRAQTGRDIARFICYFKEFKRVSCIFFFCFS